MRPAHVSSDLLIMFLGREAQGKETDMRPPDRAVKKSVSGRPEREIQDGNSISPPRILMMVPIVSRDKRGP